MSFLALILLSLQTAGSPSPASPVTAVKEEQDPDRQQFSVSDFKALVENNIFSPINPKRVPKTETKPDSKSPAAEAPRARPPVVTGLFLDQKSQAYHVVVEDRNDSRLKLFSGAKILKAGDEVAGYTIKAVTAEKVTVTSGETSGEAGLGQYFPPNGKTALPSGMTAAGPPPEVKLDDAARNEAIETLKKKLNKKPLPEETDP